MKSCILVTCIKQNGRFWNFIEPMKAMKSMKSDIALKIHLYCLPAIHHLCWPSSKHQLTIDHQCIRTRITCSRLRRRHFLHSSVLAISVRLRVSLQVITRLRSIPQVLPRRSLGQTRPDGFWSFTTFRKFYDLHDIIRTDVEESFRINELGCPHERFWSSF